MPTNNKVVARQLYDLVYETFETGHFDFFRTSSGGHNQSNEVQFRLMKNISLLGKTVENREDIINSIAADVNLALAMSWMTEETHANIEKLLGEL
jgi:hypothetical protein